jgi:hypothetical protein
MISGRSRLPGLTAHPCVEGDLVVRDIHRIGHRQQPVLILGYLTGFDSEPLGSFHTGGFFDRQPGIAAGLCDTGAKQPSPGPAPSSNYMVNNCYNIDYSYLATKSSEATKSLH